MGNKAGLMSDVAGSGLIEIWNKVLAYQTNLFGPEEVSILRQWGFGKTEKGILDAGCGNGDYGLFLAINFPKVQFFGIDSNENFIAEFYRRPKEARAGNYSIRKCDLVVDPIPKEIDGCFDQVLLRLVLQHSAKPISILKYLHDHLPKGGQLYIVEEDDGFFSIYPECPAFYQVVEITAVPTLVE